MQARMTESLLSTRGQVTIPKAVREKLGLKPGDKVRFFVHPDGTVVLLPKIPITALRGLVKSRRRSATVEEMNEAIAQGATGAPRQRHR